MPEKNGSKNQSAGRALDESFESLFPKLLEMKTKVESLNQNDRRKMAEQVSLHSSTIQNKVFNWRLISHIYHSTAI